MIVVDLPGFEYLRVSGEDAITFLQGQVSCDMHKLTADNSLHGALCNLKGRVIADFHIIQQGGDCLLQTRTGTAQKIVDTLAKYAVFSKVELSREDGIARTLGVLGTDAVAGLQETFGQAPDQVNGKIESDSGALIRLSDDINGDEARFQFWCFNESSAARVMALAETDSSLDTLDTLDIWERGRLRAGVVHVDEKLSEQYTPQLLNYDVSGVIDFNKGCYTGQEVVARMYYRGKPKQRLYLLEADTPVTKATQVIQEMAGGDKPGNILAAVNGKDGEPGLILAILATAAVDSQARLRLPEHPDTALRLAPLPYLGTL